jgi:hypothetical protein
MDTADGMDGHCMILYFSYGRHHSLLRKNNQR